MEDRDINKENVDYSAIFDAANDAIFIQDIDTGQIIDVNQTACEMFCYPKEELVGLGVYDISTNEPPYTNEEADRLIRKTAEGQPQLFQWIAKDKAGRWFWIEVNLKRAVIGGKYRLLSVVRDITERKQTEERLTKINEVFLSFGPNPQDNINHLTALCGELLGADCALYNRIEGDMLSSCGQWNVPAGFKSIDKPDGHICYDLIKQDNDEIAVFRNLQETEYAKTDPNVSAYGLQTYIGRVVKFGTNRVGTLCVVYKYDFSPTEEDKKIIGIIASALGVEEERWNADNSLLKRTQQLEMLSRTSQHINAILETPIIIRTLVAAAMELVSGTSGTAGLFIGGKMVFKEYNKDGKIKPINYAFEPGYGVPGWITSTMKPYISNDSEHDPQVAQDIRKALGFYNLVGVPILNRKAELVGCFMIYNKEGRAPFDTQDVFMLQGLAASASVALENARMFDNIKKTQEEKEALNEEIVKSNKKLKQLALKDPQTGLYNYRYLNEFIEPELYRATRYAHPLSVLMIDIDYFKSINEVYGHAFGDMVLKQFTGYLKKVVRRYDIIVRFSGAEFVIICPGADKFKALLLGQRIFDAVTIYNFGNKRRIVKLKLSIAVASFPEDKITKGIELINLADKILTKVKDEGGNKVYSSADLGKKKHTSAKILPVEPIDVKVLKARIEKLTKKGKQNLIESIFAFAKTIELKDRYTGEHVEDTVHYATEIARAMRLPLQEIDNIRQASVLHDLGKIGISDKILLKKTRLSTKEFDEIKRHPQIAADIIRPIHFMHDIIPLILYHHERWDGKGYPTGLKGEEIPMGSRIIAVADVYQALISNRPYRSAYSKKDAIAILKKGAGTQFDPAIVEIFLKILAKEKDKDK